MAIVLLPSLDVSSAAFHAQARAALGVIWSTPTGMELMRGIAAHQVLIAPIQDANAYCCPTDGDGASNPGRGSGSVIYWNPSLTMLDPTDRPGAPVILGSQLVHAYRNAKGLRLRDRCVFYAGQGVAAARDEHCAAAGLSARAARDLRGRLIPAEDYSALFPSENSLRADLKIPPRRTFFPSNWPGGPPW